MLCVDRDDASPADRRIGETVRALRGTRSQQAVAEGMKNRGYAWVQGTVSQIERGVRPLRVSEAHALADVLGDRVERLLLPRDELVVGSGIFRQLEAVQRISELTERAAELTGELRRVELELEDAREEYRRAGAAYDHPVDANEPD
jgi:transcriptional regulator with XRE-family HTH domain